MTAPAPHSAKRNFILNAAATGVNILYPLAAFAWVSRVMGPELVGRINLATSLASWFALLASAAIPLYGAREIARAREDRARLDRVFSELVTISLAMTAVSALLFGACILLSDTLRADWPLYAAAGIFILAGTASIDWFFQGLEDFPSTLIRNLAVKSGSLLLIIACVDGREDYVLFAAVGSSGALLYGLWGIWEARGRVSFRFAGARPGGHLRTLGLLAAATAASSAYIYLDGVLLGFLAGEHALGLYSTAIRITRTALVVVMALTVAVLPRLSRYLESGQAEAFTELSGKSIRTIFFLTFPMLGISWALAPILIQLLAGPGFEGAVPSLRIALLLLPLSGLTNFLGLQVLFPRGHEKPLLASALAGAAFNLSANAFLIPRFGELGSAAVAVLTEAIALGILMRATRRARFATRILDPSALLFLLGGALAGTAAGTANRLLQPWPIAVVAPLSAGIGMVVYLAFLLGAREPFIVGLLPRASRKAGKVQ